MDNKSGVRRKIFQLGCRRFVCAASQIRVVGNSSRFNDESFFSCRTCAPIDGQESRDVSHTDADCINEPSDILALRVCVSRHYIAFFPFLYCAPRSALTEVETRATKRDKGFV